MVKLFNNHIDADDMLYLDRRQYLVDSVETSNLDQPAEDLLYNGDVEQTVESLLPIVESLYDMPALRPESGSAKWLKYMKENIDQTTFGDLVDFPELLRIYVKHMKKKGNAKVAYVLVVFACVLMVSCVCPQGSCVCPNGFLRVSSCFLCVRENQGWCLGTS